MQTIQELCQQLKLTSEQQKVIEAYCGQLAIELLESIKQDNVQNFDETIISLTGQIK